MERLRTSHFGAVKIRKNHFPVAKVFEIAEISVTAAIAAESTGLSIDLYGDFLLSLEERNLFAAQLGKLPSFLGIKIRTGIYHIVLVRLATHNK
jgi:hypothetical protein